MVRLTVGVAAPPAGGATGFAAHVKCPTGKVSVGGGYYPDAGIIVTANYPVADASNPTSSWEVYGRRYSSTSTPTVYAYAVCVSG